MAVNRTASGLLSKGLTLAALFIVFSCINVFSQKPSGTYNISLDLKKGIMTEKGQKLYLNKYVWGKATAIDSTVVDKKGIARFKGFIYSLDLSFNQEKCFTAGQYTVSSKDEVILGFFYSSSDGNSFKEKIIYESRDKWHKKGKKAPKIEINQPEPDKTSIENPSSLASIQWSFLTKNLASSGEERMADIADDRLYYTLFGKQILDIFLDEFIFSKESVRNMAIDYLMENRYLTDPKMRAAVAMECFRIYSSSVVMGCEGSAVYTAEKYIIPDKTIPAPQKAEAAWFVTVNKGTLVGSKAPELRLKDTSGVERSVRELMGDHSIIYFFSDDCAYCKEETPKLVSLLDSWQEFPINIAAIYTGTDSKAWKDYIGKHFQTNNPYISWLHLADLDRESNFSVDYGIVSTPKMFLLDESLRIRGRGILTPTLSKMLEEQAEEDNKAYIYLSQIFPSEELSPETGLDFGARKDAVDKIYEGVKSSESFSRLMRQAFTYLFFCGYAPNIQTALYFGRKYVLEMPEKWEDTVFVSSVESILKAANMNAPGSKAENLTLYDIADNPADLLIPDGKMKVLYFYRTGCEVCKETLPEIRNAWKKYGKKVSFTGIFAGDNVKDFRKFVSANNLEFRQLYAKDNLTGLGDKYYIEAVPLILVTDQDGTVIFKGTSAEAMTEVLKQNN